MTKLLVLAINEGWTEKDFIMGTSVKNVKIKGNIATADYYQDKKKIGLRSQFVYENEQWKYNFTSLFQLYNSFLKQLIKELGDDEDEFIFDIEDTKWSLEEVIDKLKEDNLFDDLMKEYS